MVYPRNPIPPPPPPLTSDQVKILRKKVALAKKTRRVLSQGRKLLMSLPDGDRRREVSMEQQRLARILEDMGEPVYIDSEEQ